MDLKFCGNNNLLTGHMTYIYNTGCESRTVTVISGHWTQKEGKWSLGSKAMCSCWLFVKMGKKMRRITVRVNCFSQTKISYNRKDQQ